MLCSVRNTAAVGLIFLRRSCSGLGIGLGVGLGVGLGLGLGLGLRITLALGLSLALPLTWAGRARRQPASTGRPGSVGGRAARAAA